MRARLAIKACGLRVEHREVLLRDLPTSLLEISPKATVPVLVLSDASVLDESWEIVQWAVQQQDPPGLSGDDEQQTNASILIEMNDFSFKEDLDHYKYADRHPEHPMAWYRSEGEQFLQELEDLLCATRYLLGDQISVADLGIFPFIRQFAGVDQDWFSQAAYPKLQHWLNGFIESELFASIMLKRTIWEPQDTPQYI